MFIFLNDWMLVRFRNLNVQEHSGFIQDLESFRKVNVQKMML